MYKISIYIITTALVMSSFNPCFCLAPHGYESPFLIEEHLYNSKLDALITMFESAEGKETTEQKHIFAQHPEVLSVLLTVFHRMFQTSYKKLGIKLNPAQPLNPERVKEFEIKSMNLPVSAAINLYSFFNYYRDKFHDHLSYLSPADSQTRCLVPPSAETLDTLRKESENIRIMSLYRDLSAIHKPEEHITELLDLLESLYDRADLQQMIDWRVINRLIMHIINCKEVMPTLTNQVGLYLAVTGTYFPIAQNKKTEQLFNDALEIPGTFTLGERYTNPEFLLGNDRINFRTWVHGEIRSEIDRMEKRNDIWPPIIDFQKEKERVEKTWGIPFEDIVFLVLFVTSPHGIRIIDRIPNQIYQDVFVRIISLFVSPSLTLLPYSDKEYNSKMVDLVSDMLPKISHLSLRELFSYSVAAGALGIDLKSPASAASVITKSVANIIPYDTGTIESMDEKRERMFEKLTERAQRDFAIDAWENFETQILHADGETLLVWFHDDVAETRFDLLFIWKMLQEFTHIRVLSVPRSALMSAAHWGNDASNLDMDCYIHNPSLEGLMTFQRDGRWDFSDNGPCWGAVYGQQLSESVVSTMLKSDAIVVKGARSYEMLQGIKKDTYFAFMVCREYSETNTGVDADTGASVFIKQEAGLPSFQGFKERHTRFDRLINSSRKSHLALMTAADYVAAVTSTQYWRILMLFNGNRQKAHAWIMREATRLQVTIAQFIQKSNNAESHTIFNRSQNAPFSSY